jgi:hypothetical protein
MMLGVQAGICCFCFVAQRFWPLMLLHTLNLSNTLITKVFGATDTYRHFHNPLRCSSLRYPYRTRQTETIGLTNAGTLLGRGLLVERLWCLVLQNRLLTHPLILMLKFLSLPLKYSIRLCMFSLSWLKTPEAPTDVQVCILKLWNKKSG